MNLLALEYFIAVAEYGSFTKAASVLYVTQPTLSRYIADLEDELNAPLFIRQNRGLELTEAGKACLAEAHKIVGHVDRLIANVNNASQSVHGELGIAYFFGTNTMSAIITDFQRAFPDVNVQLSSVSLRELLSLLSDNRIDFVYSVSPLTERIPDVTFVEAEQAYLQLVLPQDHPFAGEGSVPISALKNEKFVFYERSVNPVSMDIFLDLCKKAGFTPQISRYVYDTPSMLYSVGAGQGISFCASYLKETYQPKGVAYLDIQDCVIPANLGFTFKAESTNPMIQTFISHVHRYLASHT